MKAKAKPNRPQAKWLPGLSGQRIRDWRKDNGVSREDFAKLVPCARNSVVNWETERSAPLRRLQFKIQRVMRLVLLPKRLVPISKTKALEPDPTSAPASENKAKKRERRPASASPPATAPAAPQSEDKPAPAPAPVWSTKWVAKIVPESRAELAPDAAIVAPVLARLIGCGLCGGSESDMAEGVRRIRVALSRGEGQS